MIYKDQKTKISLLFIKEVIIVVKYLDFINFFSNKLAKNQLEYLNINKHAIKLEMNKQILYKLISSLRFIKLKTLKKYIKIFLGNSFIWFFKSIGEAFILFVKKKDKNFYLYINY